MNIKIDWKDYIAWLCLLIKFYNTANNYKSNKDKYSLKLINCILDLVINEVMDLEKNKKDIVEIIDKSPKEEIVLNVMKTVFGQIIEIATEPYNVEVTFKDPSNGNIVTKVEHKPKDDENSIVEKVINYFSEKYCHVVYKLNKDGLKEKTHNGSIITYSDLQNLVHSDIYIDIVSTLGRNLLHLLKNGISTKVCPWILKIEECERSIRLIRHKNNSHWEKPCLDPQIDFSPITDDLHNIVYDYQDCIEKGNEILLENKCSFQMDKYLMIDASDKIGNCKRRVLRYIYNALVMELYRELGW